MKKLIALAAVIVSFLVSCKHEVYYSVTTKVQPDGAGNIVVSPSSDLIQEGASVTFTAKSNGEYIFTGWSGSLSGTDNPKTVTASSNLNVVANFTLRSYPLTITVEGEGSVTEKVISTKADYTSGTTIELTATPAEHWLFDHWEGDLSGNTNPLQITVTSAKSVKAVFVKRIYELPDLSRPSYELKRVYVDEDFSQFTYSSYQMLQLDYNRDGYLDVITALYKGDGGLNDSDRIPIGFYFGKPDGSFSKDEKNDGRIQGMLHIRKMIYGDFNNDDFPDIVLLGHGYDTDPFPGEYPVILMSSPGGAYYDIRFKELDGGFYHGGASGDIDNDGDLDVFLIDNFGHVGFLINEGAGSWTYTQDIVNKEVFVSLFNTELYDIDKDGNLDLICGGHDWEDESFWQRGDVSYSNCPIVFWGNGITFKDGETSRLPETAIEGYGLVCDFLFYDLDQDGVEELILARTGDGVRGGIDFYNGWAIQILKRNGREFLESTTAYLHLSDTYNKEQKYQGWIVKINIEESIDGRVYLGAAFDHPEHSQIEKLYEYKDKGLIPLYNKKEQ